MRIVSNGAICAVQAREMCRAEMWRQKQQRKENPQKRVTHEAVFHTITEVDKDAEFD